MRELAAELARSFTVYALDTPGHGGSDPLPAPDPDMAELRRGPRRDADRARAGTGPSVRDAHGGQDRPVTRGRAAGAGGLARPRRGRGVHSRGAGRPARPLPAAGGAAERRRPSGGGVAPGAEHVPVLALVRRARRLPADRRPAAGLVPARGDHGAAGGGGRTTRWPTARPSPATRSRCSPA
ncbi:hypothetical protein ACFSTC_42975 [Nonomuraea ferruginea]